MFLGEIECFLTYCDKKLLKSAKFAKKVLYALLENRNTIKIYYCGKIVW